MAKGQIETPKESIEEATARLNAEEKAKREAKQAEIKYPCATCGYAGPPKTDLSNQTELKQLALSALAEILERAPRNVSLVPAIRELWDRIEGKAAQSISIEAKDSRLSNTATDKLLRLAAMLDDPIVIAPMPKIEDGH